MGNILTQEVSLKIIRIGLLEERNLQDMGANGRCRTGLRPDAREVAMIVDRDSWLDEYAVTCRVFKGRWSIRHCVRMYFNIRDLKIRMSSRFKGKVARYESSYNPCENCEVIIRYLESQREDPNLYDPAANSHQNEMWAM